MSDSDAPKIQIDSDWKSQARAEKQRLAEKEQQQQRRPTGAPGAAGAAAPGGQGAGAATGEVGPAELPPANFETLIGMMATQALMYLGGYVDPRTGRAIVDLEAGRHQIDLLGVLEEKTKGSLNDEETRQLATVLYELRMQYVRIAQAAAAAMSQQAGGGVTGGGSAGGPTAGFGAGPASLGGGPPLRG